MSGTWCFDSKSGVVRLVEKPKGKVFVYIPSNEVITSYDILETILLSLGWERYYNVNLIFFSSIKGHPSI
ncbi:hypothetical protein ES288_A02G059100v1 [Gossypium darwinii]|uniref:Flowering-promoting factor 1 n=1 Tax=Gossypium darwinii TaxID=34276 RepID=A0A5D2HAL0_GOSDA|nr:hypothetical protein ES288_A02G059100v1 [Gossypium darwinii]